MGDLNATRQDVSRLFARAAFGATAADLDRWTGQPYATIVDHLLDIPDPAIRAPQRDEPARLALEQDRYNAGLPVRVGLAPTRAQQWWLERMRSTPYPLEERMTLFWHDHFATAIGNNPYPDLGMIVIQNQTLRRHSLGNFRDMCAAITLDPAMLYWLNGNENSVGKPNENFAREFFELFTLGTVPRVYSDTNAKPNDISEAARALTGWTVDPATRQVIFTSSRHDSRSKVVLGKTITNKGNQEYLEIVDVALAQDVSPLFVAYKLVLNFGYVPSTKDVFGDPDPLIVTIATALRASNWNLADGVRAMLLADEFRHAQPAEERQIVRQPIDLVVSASKAIGVSADNAAVVTVLTDMGQVPFEPPNVGGWPSGRDWISPVTTLARYDWGVACYGLWNLTNALLRPALPVSGDLDAWAKRFGLAGLSQKTEQLIAEYLAARSSGGATEAEKQQGVLILIASSPDWMVM